MAALFVSLALLGLAAVDPIGIAAMLVLLVQKQPYTRCLVFLGGSFVSLVVMGLLFAHGFGVLVLHFETAHKWLVPDTEVAAGLVLLGIAATVFWQLRMGRVSTEPSGPVLKRLQLGNPHLFMLGVGLVAFQSLVDVVFVIAMIRIGQLHLSFGVLVAAVVTYAIAALALQIAVVAAYALTAGKQKQQTLHTVHSLIGRYGNQAVIGVSLTLGCGLLVNGILILSGAPHI